MEQQSCSISSFPPFQMITNKLSPTINSLLLVFNTVQFVFSSTVIIIFLFFGKRTCVNMLCPRRTCSPFLTQNFPFVLSSNCMSIVNPEDVWMHKCGRSKRITIPSTGENISLFVNNTNEFEPLFSSITEPVIGLVIIDSSMRFLQRTNWYRQNQIHQTQLHMWQ